MGVTDVGDTWAAYLNRMMWERGMTKARLAELTGLTRQTISEWANGKGSSTIKIENVLRIAEALDDDPTHALIAAAGIAPEHDPEVDLILASDWSEGDKAAMVERLMCRREEQRQERVANLRFLLGQQATG